MKGPPNSPVLTVIAHALLPLTLLPFAFYVVPVFAAKASEMDFELDALTLLVFKLASFISDYWYLYVLILALLLIIDAAVILKLSRIGRIAGNFWSWSIVLIEAGFAGLCVAALVRLGVALSNIPWLCPV